jgi:hypothetical protein
MLINELHEINQLLAYVDSDYWDVFCDVWYQDLNAYREHPHSLMLMANAILNHWDVPLYAEDVSWAEADECFIWHLTERKGTE